MARRKIIHTEIGILRGRDCIYLDSLSMQDGSTVVLEGTVNTEIVREFKPPRDMPKSGELAYRLSFAGVLALQMFELDTWESQADDYYDAFSDSSFEEVLDSSWLGSLRGKVTAEHRHFAVQTYDDVVEVICRGYDLTFDPYAE